MWKKNDILINKTSVPNTTTLEKPHLFKPSMIEISIVIRVSPLDFLETVHYNIIEEVGEINITFTSDLKDMTFAHYITQTRSMLCRKLEKRFIGENFEDYNYNWLPSCFRNINK